MRNLSGEPVNALSLKSSVRFVVCQLRKDSSSSVILTKRKQDSNVPPFSSLADTKMVE